jgi:hypothetical protein
MRGEEARIPGAVVDGRAAELGVSPRMLTSWRTKKVGIVPTPDRVLGAGRTPSWSYPAHTLDQLDAAAAARTRCATFGEVRLVMWSDGWAIDPGLVKASIVKQLERVEADAERGIRRHILRHGGTRDDAIDAYAATFARKRGKLVPRFARQTLTERTLGASFMLRLLLGQPVTGDVDGQVLAFERLSGLERGRVDRIGAADPWLLGPPSEVVGFADFGSLPKLLTTARTMSARDLTAGREIAMRLLSGTRQLGVLAEAQTGRVNAGGFGAMQLLDLDDPALFAFFVPFSVGLARSFGAEIVDLLPGFDTLNEVCAEIGELAGLPGDERAVRLDAIAPENRAMVVRALDLLATQTVDKPVERR